MTRTKVGLQCIWLILVLGLSLELINWNIAGGVGIVPVVAETGNHRVYCMKASDHLLVHPENEPQNWMGSSGGKWYRIVPISKEYSSNREENLPFSSIAVGYERIPLPIEEATLEINKVLPPESYGTYYFEFSKDESSIGKQRTFFSSIPIYLQDNSFVIQVVIRPDDSYLGYLMELMHTPFVLGPRLTPAGIHQTDCRMCSDCAAFAIYGKRRQGFRIPYCGPHGIYQYLTNVADTPLMPDNQGVYRNETGHEMVINNNGLMPGEIMHFGEQVAVFYKDQGVSGVLDKDDLIFQSYGNGPYIVTLEKSGFYKRRVRAMRWKDAYRM